VHFFLSEATDMKQGPLFRRQFFIQQPGPDVPNSEAGGSIFYIRLHGNPQNPGHVLAGQRVFLSPGGMLDVVSEPWGGQGLGRVAYGPGLKAAVKRLEDTMTYRFEVPEDASHGTTYTVSAWGHDALPAFRFVIEVGTR
jgi:hypothetical protein